MEREKDTSIYLIRHGETLANVVFNEDEDHEVWDASLTPKGFQQATDLRKKLLMDDIKDWIIFVSPLTRALQTVSTCFVNDESLFNVEKIIAYSELRELQIACDDIGRSRSTLTKEFPEVDFSSLDKEIWFPLGSDEKTSEEKECESIEKVRELFKSQRWKEEGESLKKRMFISIEKILNAAKLKKEKSQIAIVGHSIFFHLLSKILFGTDLWMKNCEMKKFVLPSNYKEAFQKYTKSNDCYEEYLQNHRKNAL